MTLGDVAAIAKDTLRRWGANDSAEFAASIAYKAVFSLVPLTTFLVMIVALSFEDERRRERFVDWIGETLGIAGEDVVDLDRLVAGLPDPWSWSGLLALAIALWGASGVMTSVRRAIAEAYPTAEGRGRVAAVGGKLRDLLGVIGAALLVLVLMGVNVLEHTVRQVSARVDDVIPGASTWTTAGFRLLVPVVIVFVVFAIALYRLGDPRPPWSAVLVGSGAGTVLFLLVQVLLDWYLGRDNYSELYGAAAAVLAVLLTVYASAASLLMAANVTAAVWAHASGEARTTTDLDS